MTKSQAKKLIISIAVGLAVILIGIVAVLLIGGKKPSTNGTPPAIPVDTSSEPTSSKPTVSVPEIEVTATSSKTPSSAPVSEITVDGSPSSKATSSKPESKATKNTQTKPKLTSSQPLKVESKEQSNDPNNPAQGTSKVDENGDTWTFLDGQWWNDGPMDQQIVDDTNKIVLCPLCGLTGKECQCAPVGY